MSGEFEGLRSPGLALSVNPLKINALNDGYFDMFKISELDFQTEVVVLSACRTVSDLGNPNAGFSGLTSAFLNAGVRGVLGTQWEIESVSASNIISDFFSVLSEQDSGCIACFETSHEQCNCQWIFSSLLVAICLCLFFDQSTI